MKVCRSCRRYVSGSAERCAVDGGELEDGPLPPYAPGDSLGGYVVKRALAAGDTGVLLLCSPRDEAPKSREDGGANVPPEVLIKVVNHTGTDEVLEDRRALFESVAKLPTKETGLRPIEEVFTHEGRVCLVQPHLDGSTLAIWLRQVGVLEEQEALNLGLRLCTAVAAIHDAGLMHGDIRPGHIFIPKGSKPSEGLLFDVSLASPPQRLAPPECHDGRPDREGTDVYGTCVTLYAALTGRSPFRADSAEELSWLVRNAPPPPLRVLRPGAAVDGSLERLVMWGLAKDPAARPRLSQVTKILDALSRNDEKEVARSFPPSTAGHTIEQPVDSNTPTERVQAPNAEATAAESTATSSFSNKIEQPVDSNTPTERVQAPSADAPAEESPAPSFLNKIFPSTLLRTAGLLPTSAAMRGAELQEQRRQTFITAWPRLMVLLAIALVLGGLTVWALTK